MVLAPAGADALGRVVAAATLPRPGGGRTAERLAGLAALGAEDLSLARLAEGHADAVAILAEAGAAPVPGAVYGVWAAAGGGDVAATPAGGDEVALTGTKPFCSGAGWVDRALVTAGELLVEVDVRRPEAAAVPGTWPAVGMAGSDSRAVALDGARGTVVARGGWYTSRPGFWHGGVGVAAVWAGGARGLLDATAAALGPSTGDAEWAALGAAVAHVEAATALLDRAAAAIDAAPHDADAGRRVALATRQGVHHAATATLAATAAAGGARPLCLDGTNARRAADLHVYLAQHHPGRDAARLGRLAAGR